MKIYIYECADCNVTSGYHGGGGVVICTAIDPQAAWSKSVADEKDDDDKPLSEGLLGDPDRVIDVPDNTPEFVTIFPDQGCC